MADVIQPSNSQNSEANSQTAAKLSITDVSWRRPLAVLLAVVVIAVGLLAYNHYHKAPNSFKGYSSYTLSGLGSGSGISLQKPSVFTAPATGENVKTQQGFYQYSSSSDQSSDLVSRLMVLETAFPLTSDQASAYVKEVTTAFANPGANQTDYASFLGSINQIALNSYYKFGAEVSVGHPVGFTNSSIKSSAWQFDLTVTDPAKKMPTERGELVYLIGKNARYYVVLTSTKANWQAHGAYWQQTLNSIKIDQ